MPQWLLVAALTGYAALLDVRRREVDPAYWFAALKLAVPAGLPCWAEAARAGYLAPVALANALVLAVVGALYYLCMVGGADLLALAVVAAAAPAARGWPPFPSLLLVLLYSGVLTLAWSASLCLRALRSPLRSRAGGGLRCLVSAPMRLEELRAREWWYPSHPLPPSVKACVGYDPDEVTAELAEEGVEVVWATPGLPLLAWIALGVIAALITGAAPLLALARLLGGAPG